MNRIASVFCGLSLLLGAACPALAAPVLYTNRTAFLADSQAVNVPLPAETQNTPTFTLEDINITGPNSVIGVHLGQVVYPILFDKPPFTLLTPFGAPVPASGVIAANGEDDYLLTFDQPVYAVGITLLTNWISNDNVTLKDDAGNVLWAGSLANLSPSEAAFFFGFISDVPIKSMFVDTEGGGIWNTGISEILRLPAGQRPVPSAPANLSAAVAGGTIVLSWEDTSGHAPGFVIERRLPGAEWVSLAQVGANTESYTDASPPIGVQSQYRVRAASPFGVSDPTNEAAATLPQGGRLRVLPTRLNFGLLPAGGRRSMRVILMNVGSGPLSVSVGTPDAPFVITLGSGSFVLQPRRSRTVAVQYAPSARGSHTGRAVISSSDAVLRTVNLSMSGRAR